jgi:hypothetical protein
MAVAVETVNDIFLVPLLLALAEQLIIGRYS